MFEKLKGNIMFTKLLQRPDIDKAYAMVEPTDSWYKTITTVHNSLKEIQKSAHEIIEITSNDNLKLKGVYYPSDKASNVTVICVHGYTSHAEREWAFPGLFYLSLGYNVLIPYQRAHGLSEGKFISLGALEHKDMLNWVKKVNELNPDDSIFIHGLSMGGGIALDLADKEMKNVKGIIADAPSVSIKKMFENIANEVFKKDSEKIASHAIERFEKEFGVDANDFERVDIVSNSKYPILLSAGSKENLEELFTSIKNVNPKDTEIIILPGCDHGNGMYKQTELYQNVITNFVNKVI
ncbi:MAG: alpha/beta fold hydrolase [Ruminococcus sp.]|nr:alpha/beta fold hydrolase [Ruminococcus sp.]